MYGLKKSVAQVGEKLVGEMVINKKVFFIFQIDTTSVLFSQYMQARVNLYQQKERWESKEGFDSFDQRSVFVVITTNEKEFVGGFRVIEEYPPMQRVISDSASIEGCPEISRLVIQGGDVRTRLLYLRVVTQAVIEFGARTPYTKVCAILSETVFEHAAPMAKARVSLLSKQTVKRGHTNFMFVVIDVAG